MPLPAIAAVIVLILSQTVRIIIVRFFAFAVSAAGQAVGTFITLVATLNWDAIKQLIDDFMASDGVKDMAMKAINEAIVKIAYVKINIVLDADDPLSVASISGGVSGLIGVDIEDVTSKQSVLDGVGKYTAQQINLKLGTTFTSLGNLDGIREELGREAFIAIQNGIVGGNSFLTDSQVGTIRSLLRQTDGIYVNRTEKMERKAQLARAAQRKYSLTHKRIGGTWVHR